MLVVNPSASGNQAAFAGIDTATQGNWEGVYGGDGYSIATGTPSLPSYLNNFTVTGAGTYQWVTITTDPRAPQAGVGTGRIAATWFSNTSFSYDVNITDGNTHQVAIYAVDWDNYLGGRVERIDVLDATTRCGARYSHDLQLYGRRVSLLEHLGPREDQRDVTSTATR